MKTNSSKKSFKGIETTDGNKQADEQVYNHSKSFT